MYLVTIQPKKQGDFEPKQVLCDDKNLVECIHQELEECDSAIAIIAYVEKY